MPAGSTTRFTATSSLDTAVSVRFDPVRNVILKLEGHWINGDYEIIENIQNSKKSWYLFSTKATFTF